MELIDFWILDKSNLGKGATLATPTWNWHQLKAGEAWGRANVDLRFELTN